MELGVKIYGPEAETLNSPLRVIIILLPLAVVGGIAGLGLAGLPISVSGLVGFVALFGISIQYGVLMLERVRELELEDPDVDVFTAAKTAISVSSDPDDFHDGSARASSGSAFSRDWSRNGASVCGGNPLAVLTSVTPLTLVVLPVAMTLPLPLTRRNQAAEPALGNIGRSEHSS